MTETEDDKITVDQLIKDLVSESLTYLKKRNFTAYYKDAFKGISIARDLCDLMDRGVIKGKDII